MSLRLIEVFLPQEKIQQLPDLIQAESLLGIWPLKISDQYSLVKIMVFAMEAEAVMDVLETHFSEVEGFRIILLSVEASVPRPQRPEEKLTQLDNQQSDDPELDPQLSRINRQELYEDIADTVILKWTHILMVILSATIAAIGLLRDSSTTIIGAMVIAPLLGPNMALALATTLADKTLGLQAVKIGSLGISVTLGMSILVGYIFPANPDIPEIVFRTKVSSSDVILALASGIAGALSFTSGFTSSIVGVTVSVALLPPLVVFGMLIGSGFWQPAIGAILLFLTNLICLNLAGVITFSVQEIQPGKWWEVYKAQKATRIAFWLWGVLLVLMVIGIVIWQRVSPLG